MSKHTPGPWTWESDHTWKRFEIYQLAATGLDVSAFSRHICTINNIPDHHVANRDAETAKANARLIAAAPTTLELLQRIAFVHSRECTGCELLTEVREHLTSLGETIPDDGEKARLRALAIAKGTKKTRQGK